jgi:hypothetical protein
MPSRNWTGSRLIADHQRRRFLRLEWLIGQQSEAISRLRTIELYSASTTGICEAIGIGYAGRPGQAILMQATSLLGSRFDGLMAQPETSIGGDHTNLTIRRLRPFPDIARRAMAYLPNVSEERSQ